MPQKTTPRDSIRLNIGSGNHKLDGFINVDIEAGADVVADVTAGLPFASGSVDCIYSEHFIEHISQAQVLRFFRECRRVLKPGARVRVATPDLDHIIQRYQSDNWRAESEMVQRLGWNWLDNNCEQLNLAMRSWGHQWVMNETELVRLAAIAGLIFVGRFARGESSDERLRGLEHREGSRLICEFETRTRNAANGEALVSILIPAYKPQFFEATLQSALDQSCPNKEIVICDDSEGSAIADIVEKYVTHSELFYHKNPEHLGGRANYLRCFELASGEYIKFLNDDDLLHPQCCERMAACLDAMPQVTLVTSHRQCIDAFEQWLPDLPFNRRPTTGDSLISGESAVNVMLEQALNFIGEPSTPMFRRRDIRDTRPHLFSFGGRAAHRNGDVTLWTNLLSKGDLLYLQDSLGFFRLHTAQVQTGEAYRQEADRAWQQVREDAQRMGLLHPPQGNEIQAVAVQLHLPELRDSSAIPVLNPDGAARVALPDIRWENHLEQPAETLVSLKEQDWQLTDDETRELENAVQELLQGNAASAYAALGSLLQRRPAAADVLLGMVISARMIHGADLAAAYLQKLILLQPRFAPALHEAALMLLEQGHDQVAAHWLQRAVELAPDFTDARREYGDVLLRCGDTAKGYRILTELADQEPPDIPALLYLARHEVRNTRYSEALTHLQNILALDGKNEAALKLLLQMNAQLDAPAAPPALPAVPEESSKTAPANGHSTPEMIFVVGSARSGTSALAQSLGKHSQTAAGPETDFLDPLARAAAGAHAFGSTRGIHHWLSNRGVGLPEFMSAIGDGLNALFTRYSGSKRWIDQTPGYALCMAELSLMFPSARFVHIIRDGRKVVHSMLNSGFDERWARDFDYACQTWMHHVMAALYFESQLPQLVKRCYNELLNQDAAAQMQSLQAFLNLPYEAATANLFAADIRLNTSFKGEQAGAADWRRQWSAEQCRRFQETAGRLLVALGYEQDDSWVEQAGQAGQRLPDAQKPALEILQALDGIGDKLQELNRQAAAVEVTLPAGETDDKTPLVSIIIPVFNHLKLTHQCIKSILSNTHHKRYEVVVVDNGSSDGSADYLAGLDNPRIKAIVNQDNRGFVEACNQGAELAAGDYLLLLNNDTEVQPGWLAELVRTMEKAPQCGAVGSKLVYPDGRLQEAGGIIFSDGNGWNFGRGMSPQDPRFNYLREVDYCSGAALMVRSDIWRQLGGLDTRYAPAYYEDTDLCFSVRKLGYRCYYQPRSVVIHHEGQTAGTDLQSGMKRYQELNRAKFVEKWQQELQQQPQNLPGNVPKAANRRNRRSVFVVDPVLPFYDRASGSLRLFHLLRLLRDMDYHVTFLSISAKMEEQYLPKLQQMGIEVLCGYLSAAKKCGYPAPDDDPSGFYEMLFKERQYDEAILSFYHIADAFIPVLRRTAPQTRIIVDSVDIHFVRQLREAELQGSEQNRLAALAEKEKEMAVYRAADRLWVVTPADAAAVREELGDLPIDVMPNIHAEVHWEKSRQETSDLLFVGNFNHPPNKDAVEYFCADILPDILRELPEVRLIIAGNGSQQAVGHLESPQVMVLGYVEDLSALLKKARISVNPLRYGAGMKGKIGEALSWGLPVVTTSVGAEGMQLADEVHALIADDPAAFAAAVLRLYNDEPLWRQLSQRGREQVRQLWSPEQMRRRLDALFAPEQLLEGVAAAEVGKSAEMPADAPSEPPAATAAPEETAAPAEPANQPVGEETVAIDATAKENLPEDEMETAAEAPPEEPVNDITERENFAEEEMENNQPVGVSRPEEAADKQSAPEESAENEAPEQQATTTPAPVSIVILTCNALEYTRKCVDAIREHTDLPCELVFVDNGSSDGTVEYLRGLQKEDESVQLQENASNLGFAAGNNQGVQLARGEFVLLLNNDVLVSEGWLEGLLEAIQLDRRIGAVGPITNRISGRQMVREVPYHDDAGFHLFAARVRRLNKGKVTPRRRLAGFALLMRRQDYLELSGFDESFGAGNFEDDDLSLRIRRRGLALMVDESTFIHHYGSRTFIANGMDYQASLTEKMDIFHQKWPGVDYEELIETKNPLSERHDELLGKGTAAMLGGQLEQAEELLSSIVRDNPLSVDANYGLALVAREQKQYPRSLEYFNTLVQLDPESAPVLNDIGSLLLEMGDNDNALKMFARAIQFDADFVEARRNYGDALIQAEDYENGISVFNKILEHTPDDVNSLLYLAHIHAEAGNPPEARELLQRVIRLEPENETALSLQQILQSDLAEQLQSEVD